MRKGRLRMEETEFAINKLRGTDSCHIDGSLSNNAP